MVNEIPAVKTGVYLEILLTSDCRRVSIIKRKIVRT